MALRRHIKGLIGKEDLNIGSGTFSRLTSTGGSQTLTKINLNSLMAGVYSVLDYGATGDGSTDDTTAIQNTINAAETAGYAVYIPAGTFMVSDTVVAKAQVPIFGLGHNSILKAAANFSTTNHSLAGKSFSAPVLLIDGTTNINNPDTISFFENFLVDGNAVAATGICIVHGAQNYYHNLKVNKVTEDGIIVDGSQNSVFVNCRSSRSIRYNWNILNGVGNCLFDGCYAWGADSANLHSGTDTNYPSTASTLSFTEPTQNMWSKGVFENGYPVADGGQNILARCIHLEAGDRWTFEDINVATVVTQAQIDIESGAGQAHFYRPRFSMPAGTYLAFRSASADAVLLDPSVNTSSSGNAAGNLFECEAATHIIRPIITGAGVGPGTANNKLFADTSGAVVNQTAIIRVELLRDRGQGGSRPYEDSTDKMDPAKIDAILKYYDQTLGEWIYYDYLTDQTWKRLNGYPAGTPGSELTIASGAITVTADYHQVDTEADAATDNLDTINGGIRTGQTVILKAINAARTVVVRDTLVSGGNIATIGDVNVSLQGSTKNPLVLIWDGVNWVQIGGSAGAIG